MRQHALVHVLVLVGVSIHAPRAGCDACSINSCTTLRRFQFTHPVRGATILQLAPAEAVKFQFTHPVRGATVRVRAGSGCFRVSIHAPRAGCDANELTSLQFQQLFQFTHPVRGATIVAFVWAPEGSMFQFTHPVRGATSALAGLTSSFDVSIHAPRAGCDSFIDQIRLNRFLFQFTHPVRGATWSALRALCIE